MRKIKYEEYNKKRQASKVKLLQIRDKLEKEKSAGLKERDTAKRVLLFKLAKKKKEETIEKIGERKYRFKE